jgi:hypothetical protein
VREIYEAHLLLASGLWGRVFGAAWRLERLRLPGRPAASASASWRVNSMRNVIRTLPFLVRDRVAR